MFENEIIEMEDFSFNHYIHHFDECEGESIEYNKEYDCMAVVAECFEEVPLDEGFKFYYSSIS